MTKDEILTLPDVKEFLDNFARYCGTSRAVFEGQFSVAVKAVEAAMQEQCAQIADATETANRTIAARYTKPGLEALRDMFTGQANVAKVIAEVIRALG